MGGCCSKDLDDKRSWSPEETKNGSTTSTIIAQPMDDVGSTGVFTLTRTTATTTTTAMNNAGTTKTTTTSYSGTAQQQQQQSVSTTTVSTTDPAER